LSDSHIVALDEKTGRLLWTGYMGNAPAETAVSGPRLNFPGGLPGFTPSVGFISNAPTYVNGMLISGLTGGDGGVRGKISGLDAKTGKLVWDFYVVPSPGEAGSETWPKEGNALKQGGGAVWTHGAADAGLGLVFYGTGNAVPQLGGEVRPGDNLYIASVVALDIKTGKLKWYYQLTHHDIWEMDAGTPIVLYTVRVNGRSRKALAAMRTDGYLFLLDRETGKPIYPIEERPVKQDIRLSTAPTQPFPVNADEFGPSCADPETVPPGFKPGCYFDPLYYDKPDVAFPLMTARHAPMSFDPATGYFYVMGMVHGWWIRRMESPYILLGSHLPDAREYGIYAAIDGHTNKIVWEKRSPWGLAAGGGALTTAGGLLFHMQGDGTFMASDAKTGTILWQFQTGFLGLTGPNSLVGGIPAASYEFQGEQYIAVPMGKGLWTFKLGGTVPPRPAPAAPPQQFSFDGIVQPLADDGSGVIRVANLQSGGTVGAGQEHYVDEYTFAPTRARVRAGVAFKWTNFGAQRHSIESSDGSWATGEVLPAQSITMSITKPGTYEYFCKDHPWSKGQLIVTAPNEPSDPVVGRKIFTAAQTARGKSIFLASCSNGCHMPDLAAGTRAPALAGDSFRERWQGHSGNELFERIRDTMPQQSPHSLSDGAYVDIVAFLLQANGYAAGEIELRADPGVLENLVVFSSGDGSR